MSDLLHKINARLQDYNREGQIERAVAWVVRPDIPVGWVDASRPLPSAGVRRSDAVD